MLFFGRDEKKYLEVHSLATLGGLAAVMPFIIKAYIFSLSDEDKRRLFSVLECLVLRHRLIGTSAYIESRLNGVYQNFTKENPDIQEIQGRIEWMKSEKSYYWGHWNTDHLKTVIDGNIDHSTAKYILWKYENYLERKGQDGYTPRRFDTIISPELEHIAPKTPTKGEPVASGYDEYDEEFVNEYIDCLGNYLLISKSHNCVIGNKPFVEKWASYDYLEQQREVQNITEDKKIWNKDKINERHRIIVKFILDNL
jgi:hypothetical protein